MAKPKPLPQPQLRRQGRPYVGGGDRLLALRMSPELVTRIDTLAELEGDMPGRSEMMRRLLVLGCEQREKGLRK